MAYKDHYYCSLLHTEHIVLWAHPWCLPSCSTSALSNWSWSRCHPDEVSPVTSHVWNQDNFQNKHPYSTDQQVDLAVHETKQAFVTTKNNIPTLLITERNARGDEVKLPSLNIWSDNGEGSEKQILPKFHCKTNFFLSKPQKLVKSIQQEISHMS